MKTTILLTAMALLGFSVCLTGCGSFTAETIEEHQAQIEDGVKALQDLGVEAWLVYRLPLRVGLHTSTEFGSDGEIFGLIRVNPGE